MDLNLGGFTHARRLEIVTGIDSTVFIAILADKLPQSSVTKARVLSGLSLALISMRLALLSIISWLVTLWRSFASLGFCSYSGRDLIMLLGGIFLLFKSDHRAA